MLNLTELIGFGAGGGGLRPLSTAPVTTAQSTANSSSYTLSSVSLGTGDYVLIAITGTSASASGVKSCTLDGIPAITLTTGGSNTQAHALFVHPGASTGTVVVTFNATSGACRVHVFAVSGDMLSLTPQSTFADTSTPLSVSADIAAGGIVLGSAADTSTGAHSFTAGLSNDFGAALDGALYIIAGHYDSIAGDTGRTISSDCNALLLVTTWR